MLRKNWQPILAAAALAALWVYARYGTAALVAALVLAVTVPVSAAYRRATSGRVRVPLLGRWAAASAAAVGVLAVAVGYGPRTACLVLAAAAAAAAVYTRTGHYKRLRRLQLAWLSVLDLVGGDPADPRRRWLRVRRFPAKRRGQIDVRCDPSFHGWDERRVLAVRDAVAWRMGQDYEAAAHGASTTLRLTPCEPIPAAAALDASVKIEPGVLHLARGRAARLVSVPLGDVPHLLVVGGSGGGKSVTLRTIATQAAQWAELVLCDTQRVDLLGIGGPNVDRAETLDEITAAVSAARAEIDDRIDIMRRNDGAACDAPWRLLVLDEGAALRAMAEAVDKRHPVLSTLPDVVRLGRKVRVQLVVALQRPDVSQLPALAAGEMRDNIGTRIVAGRLRSPQGAAMALTDPMAQEAAQNVPNVPGRGLVERNGAWTECQLLNAPRRKPQAQQNKPLVTARV